MALEDRTTGLVRWLAMQMFALVAACVVVVPTLRLMLFAVPRRLPQDFLLQCLGTIWLCGWLYVSMRPALRRLMNSPGAAIIQRRLGSR